VYDRSSYIASTHVENKAVINVLFRNVRVEVLAFDKAKEKLVHNLDMWPGHFKDRFIFLRVEGIALWIHGRWNGSKQVLAEHVHHTRVHTVGDDLAIVRHIIEQLMQRKAFDFLRLHVPAGVIEIENDVALVDLLHE